MTLEKSYNPYRIPPDWDAAQRHAVKERNRNKLSYLD